MEREIQSDVATESTGGHDEQSIIKPGKYLHLTQKLISVDPRNFEESVGERFFDSQDRAT